MADVDAGQLEEFIYTFSFRNVGTIRIPPSIYKKGYIQSLDIIVNSIDFNLYESAKSAPPTQFYGYATLVFQDCLSLEIPIHFPRQRIYHKRNEDALSQWRRLAESINFTKDWFQTIFSLLTSGAEEPPPEPTIIFPEPRFVALPLREVYVKLQANTQFQIEFTQWEPVIFVDDQGTIYNGSTPQEDGEKDGGLPSDGIQPKRNSPDNPFGGNSPESTPTELGDFNNSDKLGALDDVDPNNTPDDPNQIPEGKSYWVRMAGSFKNAANGCSTETFEQYFSLRSYDDTVRAVTDTFISDSCGGVLVTSGRILSNLDDFQYGNSTGGGNYVATYLASDDLSNPFL